MGYGVEESTPPGRVPPLFAEHQSVNHDEVPGETGPAFLKIGRYPRGGYLAVHGIPPRGVSGTEGGVGSGNLRTIPHAPPPLIFRVRQNGIPGSGAGPDARE